MGPESAQPRVRQIARRTRGRTQGPAIRLMSPSDFGEILKPFVFLDLFDHQGALQWGPPDAQRAPFDHLRRERNQCRQGNNRDPDPLRGTGV